MNTQQSKIGAYIAQLRKQQNLTQAQFAKKLKTSQSAVVRMEKGDQNFSTEMLAKIGAILKRDLITVSEGVTHFRVQGGKQLSGVAKAHTAQNSAIAALFASLLNQEQTILRSIPAIEEIQKLITIFEAIGITIERNGETVTVRPPKTLKLSNLNEEHISNTRSAILLLGILPHYARTFSLPLVSHYQRKGRSLLPHLYVLEQFGMTVTQTPEELIIDSRHCRPGTILLSEASDLATENAVLLAASLPGTSTIKFASANYQVQDLCVLLRHMGVSIEGIGTSQLTITGSKAINKPISYTPSEDPIEAMTMIAAGTVTQSHITIQRSPIEFLELELMKLKHMNLNFSITNRTTALNGHTQLADITIKPSTLTASPEPIHPMPYPGINIDNLPLFVPIATQAQGKTLIHDWVHTNRAIHFLELNKLGASITYADQHRIFVEGRTPLRGADIICPPDLRPSSFLLIAMLAADGVSTLRNVYTINRGFEEAVLNLNSLGASISTAHVN